MFNYSAQKSALTRAQRSGDPRKVVEACRKAVREWDEYYWPDDWARWQRALDEAMGWAAPRLEDLSQ